MNHVTNNNRSPFPTCYLETFCLFIPLFPSPGLGDSIYVTISQIILQIFLLILSVGDNQITDNYICSTS